MSNAAAGPIALVLGRKRGVTWEDCIEMMEASGGRLRVDDLPRGVVGD